VSGLAGHGLDAVIMDHERQAQDRLDPVVGVMLQAVWFDAGQAAGRLLMVAHHLVVDGVSWRILLADLAAAWQAISAGRDPWLGYAGLSFPRWARLLGAQSRDPARVAELAAWTAVLEAGEPPLEDRPLDPGRDTVATMVRVSLPVPPEVAAALLTRIPAMFQVGVDDLLLAGLAAAVTEWRARHGREQGPVLVDVEGHGREQIAAGLDLSATVGWFTSVHPVRLDPGCTDFSQLRDGGPAAGEVIKRVKEQVRAVPGDGLGFGLLRYLNPDTAAVLAALPSPRIGFNYLGRFTVGQANAGPPRGGSAGQRGDWQRGDWQPTGDGVPSGSADTATPAAHVLEAGGLVRDLPAGPQMTLSLSWPRAVISETAVRELGQGWLAMLGGLTAHAARPGTGGLTPSDLPLVALSQDEVDEFEVMAGEMEGGR
jgi:nonribosomal peptide synthetase CepB